MTINLSSIPPQAIAAFEDLRAASITKSDGQFQNLRPRAQDQQSYVPYVLWPVKTANQSPCLLIEVANEMSS
jgi:hypothetical protein